MKIKDQAAFDHLRFKHYLESKEFLSKDFITVARIDSPSVDDSFLIFSALIKKSDSQNVIKNSDWEIRIDFGHPNFTTNEGKIAFNRGISFRDNVLIEPFMFHREPVGSYDSQMDILQEFLLYHDLRLNDKGNYENPKNKD